MYLTPNIQKSSERPLTIAYYLALVSEGLVTSVFGPAMVYFAARTHCTVAEITTLLVFYNIGFIFSSLVIVRQFDRLPGNRMIGTAIFSLIGVLIGLCLVQNKWLLFILAGIMGLANAVIENGPNILFPWLLGNRGKRPLNLIYLFYSFGCIVTPILIGFALRTWNNLTPVFVLIAVLIFYPALNLFRLPSPRGITDTVSDGQPRAAESSHAIMEACLFGFFLFLFSSGLSTFSNWTSTVLLRNELADEAGAAMMSSIIWTGSLIGRLAGAWLADKLASHKIVLYGLLIAIADGIVMFFCKGSLLLIGTCVLINGIATGPIIANALAIMKGRGLVSAKINGLVLAMSQLGCMILPSLFGRIWGDSTASYTPFTAITLGASLAELIVLRFILRHKEP